ncbi:MAG: TRZ/ATZ family hydrolase [Rhodocyclaceae bacterium]|jgi:5-methylthioadenosine/S-adenosylhomocysteine deaminase|nr:5-methylthioadenosine/S-adenosylhomocysteine deaminase [Rhodocyclaceae bacterium]MBZ0143246.1 TRZ/ATZ family hydrolase [Rhodocyclaceae bacterium]MCC6880444.1 TRZ/ATZ family hydrolase [Rhodocyclaceae bacterium]MCL4679671.1 TRZ/ATZ family hydrolase [Rhodocyclaceae bacterium]
MSEPIDLLIEPRWLIPVEPRGAMLEGQAVAVSAGDIVDVLPAEAARQRYLPARHVVLADHVLIPGLVNLHTHAAMTLLRGIADDLPLMEWLKNHIWPAEAKHVSAAFVRDGTLLACAEMLRGGITCFNDMYFFPEAAAEAARSLGMRAVLGLVVIEFPTAYAADAEDYIVKGLAARDRLRGDPLVSFCMAPHAPYTVSDASFERIATLAAQLDLPVHIHVHETRGEIEESVRRHGLRPIERLDRLGMLGPGLIAVHAAHLDAAEIRLLAKYDCSVAHCPTSNMKLASGIAPIVAKLGEGIRVGLGTDGAASNNRLDLFQEMRHAALLAKAVSGNAAAFDAHTVLRMATLNGAAALGLGDRIGSIEAGKAADLCAVRLNTVETAPCFNPASHLVYAAGREHVSHVWVNGVLQVENGALQQCNTSRLLDIAYLWQNKLTA